MIDPQFFFSLRARVEKDRIESMQVATQRDARRNEQPRFFLRAIQRQDGAVRIG